MRFKDYCALDAINVSSLLYMAESPKHYKHYVEHGRPDSDTLAIGRAAHTGTLEPHQFLREYALWPAENGARRGKKFAAFKEANEGKTILTEAQYAEAMAMAEAVRADPVAAKRLAPGGETEVSLQWDLDGRPAKCRIDYLTEDCIVDLKTCRTAEPGAFGRSAARLGYDVRGAFYQDAVRQKRGVTLPVIFIAVEKAPPYDVVVWRTPEHVVEAGREKYRELLDKLRECEERDEWPGWAAGVERLLEFPSWALTDETDLIVNGTSVPI